MGYYADLIKQKKEIQNADVDWNKVKADYQKLDKAIKSLDRTVKQLHDEWCDLYVKDIDVWEHRNLAVWARLVEEVDHKLDRVGQ